VSLPISPIHSSSARSSITFNSAHHQGCRHDALSPIQPIQICSGNANNSQATAPPARILPQLPVSPRHPYVNRHARRAISRQVQSISITRQSHAATPTPSILLATQEKTRYFPYSPEVLSHCDALVDLHTASNQRANLPQIRADLSDPEIRDLAIHFGLGIVVGGTGPNGSLRREAAKAGIPAIIYEAGEPFRFQEDEIERGVRGVKNIMAHLDMIDGADREIPDTRVYERSRWVRTAVGNGGFFFPTAKLGDVVRTGDSLGRIVDPLTDAVFEVISPMSGEIIGMAVARPVLSGFALFNLAWHEAN